MAKKLDFRNISIITHVKIDCPERMDNINIREKYYRDRCDNLEIIYVEEDTTSKLGVLSNSCAKHYLLESDGPHRKGKAYTIRTLEIWNEMYSVCLPIHES